MKSTLFADDAVIVIAVDSELVAIGLTVVLSTRRNLHVAAVAHTLEAAEKAIQRHRPDLLLAGLEFAQPLQQRIALEPSRVLALGRNWHIGVPDADTGSLCGFISYAGRRNDYLPLVDTVAHCPQRTASMDSSRCRGCPVRRSLQIPPLGLSSREYQIFTGIGRGFGSSELAAELGVSVKTVETHRESIKRKLGLDSARNLNNAAAGWCRGEVLDENDDA